MVDRGRRGRLLRGWLQLGGVRQIFPGAVFSTTGLAVDAVQEESALDAQPVDIRICRDPLVSYPSIG